MQEKIVILDFGSQYTQLIARRVRELNVYCEIHPFNKIPELDASVRGVILSGSPFSVRDEKAPKPDLTAIKGRLPLLGVCYGAQYLAHFYGGEVQSAPSREYGRAMLTVVEPSDPLMQGVPSPTQVWMSHGDTITSVPDTYRVIASTEDVRYAAFRIEGERSWGIQFHPEVYHSTDGITLLRNFVVGICGCKQDWTPESFVETTVRELREKLGDDRVVLGLSGGVDSSVAAVLLHRAIGKNLYCIFVDSGLLRKNEFDSVLESYKGMGLNVKGVKAHDRFLGDLAGVTDPEKKRNHYGKGKYLLRKAFEGDWLPPEILWREKAAFSDAVGHSMVDDIKEYAESLYTDEEFQLRRANYSAHCMPFTKESLFYREIFEKYYHDQSRTIVGFWMPNKAWPNCNVNDPSARVLANYGASGV